MPKKPFFGARIFRSAARNASVVAAMGEDEAPQNFSTYFEKFSASHSAVAYPPCPSNTAAMVTPPAMPSTTAQRSSFCFLAVPCCVMDSTSFNEALPIIDRALLAPSGRRGPRAPHGRVRCASMFECVWFASLLLLDTSTRAAFSAGPSLRNNLLTTGDTCMMSIWVDRSRSIDRWVGGWMDGRMGSTKSTKSTKSSQPDLLSKRRAAPFMQ
mmetsp:Transcript_819/g.2243  ORF Transcript_819/g.2243 Transcript_819/m.2243 type:complete len:212 (-) Transcript_819:645-1280(-)